MGYWEKIAESAQCRGQEGTEQHAQLCSAQSDLGEHACSSSSGRGGKATIRSRIQVKRPKLSNMWVTSPLGRGFMHWGFVNFRVLSWIQFPQNSYIHSSRFYREQVPQLIGHKQDWVFFPGFFVYNIHSYWRFKERSSWELWFTAEILGS